MIVVMVAEKIGIATSRAASRTAVRRGVPGMFRCRLMFSSSTIESSTSRPTARARPPRVKTLSDWPRKYIQMNDRRIDRGIAIEMISVDVNDRRKTRITTNAIPLSILLSFICMYFLGQSLNVFTLEVHTDE